MTEGTREEVQCEMEGKNMTETVNKSIRRSVVDCVRKGDGQCKGRQTKAKKEKREGT